MLIKIISAYIFFIIFYLIDGINNIHIYNYSIQSFDKNKSKKDSLNYLYNFSPESLKIYKNWANNAIKKSQVDNSYAIIVIKADYELHLYKGGRLIKSFPIELGLNPIADKNREGDNSTPEGEFYVCEKIPNSTYYKALLISYPNKEDAERGLKEKLIDSINYLTIVNAIKSKSTPPQNTKLGGELEIHGHGHGKKGNEKNGINWTFGCVALSNKDIDELYTLITIKTPIVIVKYIKEF